MKTFVPQIITDNQQRKWFVVDAQDKVLGRLATEIANVLRGKNKATFTPHLDLGDYVVVINAEKVKLTGAKLENKIYYKHTGYIGHLRQRTAQEMLDKKPEEILFKAVSGMVPRNKLRNDVLKRFKVVIGPEHQYQAQQPEVLTLDI